jgi:small-conductance mechanosensitive channel
MQYSANKSNYGQRLTVVRSRRLNPRGARILAASGAADAAEIDQKIALLESDLAEQRRLLDEARHRERAARTLLERVRDAEMQLATASRTRNVLEGKLSRARAAYDDAQNLRIDNGDAEAKRLDSKYVCFPISSLRRASPLSHLALFVDLKSCCKNALV